MNHLQIQKSYRPDPHAQYLLQLLALPTALVLIAAVRYVLKVVPAGIVNLICSLLLLAALLGILFYCHSGFATLAISLQNKTSSPYPAFLSGEKNACGCVLCNAAPLCKRRSANIRE